MVLHQNRHSFTPPHNHSGSREFGDLPNSRCPRRRQLRAVLFALFVSLPMFLGPPGCAEDDPGEWKWVLTTTNDLYEVGEPIIGVYVLNNSAQDVVDVGLTTELVSISTGAATDQLTQVISLPADGTSYSLGTDDLTTEVLTATEPGRYFLRGRIRFLSVEVSSPPFNVVVQK